MTHTKSKGALYLIPNTLGGHSFHSFFPQEIQEILRKLDGFLVENEKAARLIFKIAGVTDIIDQKSFYPLNEHTTDDVLIGYLQLLLSGKQMGIISDAGCPAVADPGAGLIRMAHQNNISIYPLVGPSSILLALMASGLNGQQFTFHGYLPREKADRIRSLRELEKESARKNATQIFIETPYRNHNMLDDIFQHCIPSTLLCIATDITLETQSIKTREVSIWKKAPPDLRKRPCVFLLLA